MNNVNIKNLVVRLHGLKPMESLSALFRRSLGGRNSDPESHISLTLRTWLSGVGVSERWQPSPYRTGTGSYWIWTVSSKRAALNRCPALAISRDFFPPSPFGRITMVWARLRQALNVFDFGEVSAKLNAKVIERRRTSADNPAKPKA